MVGIGEAIANGFKNYVNFNGRSTRAEYWWWYLFNIIILIVAVIIDISLFGVHNTTQTLSSGIVVRNSSVGGPTTAIVALGLLIPNLALGIRRLHDTGRRWYWIFMGLIPFVGGIILIVLYCLESSPNGLGEPTSDKNPYGGGATGSMYGSYPTR